MPDIYLQPKNAMHLDITVYGPKLRNMAINCVLKSSIRKMLGPTDQYLLFSHGFEITESSTTSRIILLADINLSFFHSPLRSWQMLSHRPHLSHNARTAFLLHSRNNDGDFDPAAKTGCPAGSSCSLSLDGFTECRTNGNVLCSGGSFCCPSNTNCQNTSSGTNCV